MVEKEGREKGGGGGKGDRPPRHVNEFFEGRAGRAKTIDKRRELEVRESREVGVVWQQRRERERENGGEKVEQGAPGG